MIGNTRRFVFGLIFTFSAIAGAQQQTDTKPSKSKTFFPKPTCPVEEAIVALQQKLESDPLPAGDGLLPWPGLRGLWHNAIRDAYVTVLAKELPSNKRSQVTVEFRSLCSGVLLAEGARIITSSDWKRDYLTLRLRNLGLPNGNLLVYLKQDSTEKEKDPSIVVYVFEDIKIKKARSTTRILRDYFVGKKL